MEAPSKTERFEMRMDPSLLESLDAWRKTEEDIPSRAEAIRRLVESGIASSRSSTTHISDGEKLILTMLCDLYKKTGVKSEIDPDFVQSVIYGGHYWGLRWKYSGLFHDHKDAPAKVTFVVDVLDMWSFIEGGYERLTDEGKILVGKEASPFGANVKFPGFDGNNESEYMSIARFMIDDLDRFQIFKGRDSMNSHMPTLGGYRRMLDLFIPMRLKLVGRGLSDTEIVALLNARRYTDRDA